LLSSFFGDNLPDDGLVKAEACTRDILNDTYYLRVLPAVQFVGSNICFQSIERYMDDIKFWKDLMATTIYKRLAYFVTEYIIFSQSKLKAEFIPHRIH